ncbi:MAG: CBS domain-containing protein [bacterium]
MAMEVSKIMNRNVVTVSADTPVKEVARKMVEGGYTGLPVVSGDEVIGIVTEADLIMQKSKIHLPHYLQLLDSFLYLEDPKDLEEDLHKIIGVDAEEVMTKPVVTVNSTDTIENAATLFSEHHVNPIPVVDHGKLVGILSRNDIVRLLAR